MTNCPSLDLLRQFLEEQISPADQTVVELHVETCLACQDRLERLTQGFSSLRDKVAGQESTGLNQPAPTAPRQVGVPDPGQTDLHCSPDTPGPTAAEPSGEGGPAGGPQFPDVAGYEVLSVLGRGGMGVVYKARQQRLKRLVALKMIRAATADEEEYQARFRAEAEAVARLRHPNVLQIYEVGEAAGLPFFALELLEGGSLQDRLRAGPLPARQAADLLATLARAVHAAHSAGVVHRDLKPGNVLFTTDGIPKVADFGLAKRLEEPAGCQTQTGQIVGSPHYMAPEQARGDSRDVGPAADLHALGVILYELLTGRVPFQGAAVLETLRLVQEAEPVPPRRLQPAVPRDLDTICLKCLHKEPARRYASAALLADDLDRFLHDRPIQARATPAWERARKLARRNPAKALAAAVALVVVLTAAGGALWRYLDGVERERRDQRELAEKDERFGRELLDAQAALGRGDWQQAREAAAILLTGLEPEPRLNALKARAEAVRTEADRALVEASRKAGEQAKYQRFLALRDEAFFRDAGFTGLDTEANRAALRSAAAEALKLFGAEAPASLQPDEQARLREGRYELLLVLAAAADPRSGEAARHLAEASRLRAPTSAYHLRRAKHLEQQGNPAGAAQARAAADRLEPSSAFDHFLTGLERYRAGDAPGLVRAQEHFRTALLLQPDHFWAQYLLALCHLRAEAPRFGEAVAGLTACLARRSDHVWLYLLRGYAQAEAGHAAADPVQLRAADADYRRAADLLGRRADPDAEYVLLVNRGALRVRQKRFAEAVRDLQGAVLRKPGQLPAYVNLSQAYAGLGRWAEARAQLDQAVRLRPELALPYRARAQLAEKQKAFAAALADLEAAARREHSRSPLLARDHADRSRLLLRARRPAEALAAAAAALRITPTLAGAQALRVAALLELGRHDELLPACDAYLAQEGPPGAKADRAELFRVRALARARQRDYPGALADYHQALALAPDSAELRAGRGWVYLLGDAPRLALVDFEEAVRRQPGSADALNGRGLARVKLRQVAGGAADAEAAVRLDPSNARTLYNAARTCAQAALLAEVWKDGPQMRARQYEERAWDLLRQAVAGQPESGRAAFWSETVQKDEALAGLRRKREFAALAARYAAPAR
jgi:tRNA A-37 threonylcarbamoyl transferase component Bud32/Tfp pilus assembly protein PilF